MTVAVVIPAYNEETTIGAVLDALPREHLVQVLVGDNRSTDATAEVARAHGATVIPAPAPGYGFACLCALTAVRPEVDTIVFLDGDGSDCSEQMPALLTPLREGNADLVVGSRIRGVREPGALPSHAAWGNRLACFLIRRLYGVEVSDLGPFRAIRREVLEDLDMQPAAFRWTTEMIVKAARRGYLVTEVPTGYRRRGGRSKISGTVRGSVMAGMAILDTVFRYAGR